MNKIVISWVRGKGEKKSKIRLNNVISSHFGEMDVE